MARPKAELEQWVMGHVLLFQQPALDQCYDWIIFISHSCYTPMGLHIKPILCLEQVQRSSDCLKKKKQTKKQIKSISKKHVKADSQKQ